MSRVIYQEQAIELNKNESVLDALLRMEYPVAYSCKTGSCHSCLMKSTRGTVPENSRSGLKDSMKEQGFFLPCICYPESELEICPADSGLDLAAARILKINPLSEDVAQVILETTQEFEFRAGQFLNLIKSDGLVRSYSIASLPTELPYLELHVRKVTKGKMSSWLCSGDATGSEVKIRGPAGDCFYLPQYAEQNLLLAGTGTGLAPLLGILRDAIRQNHPGEIYLYHGGRDLSSLYLEDDLRSLESSTPNFHYLPCPLSCETPSDEMLVGPIDESILSHHSDLSGWRVFLCGSPEIVNRLRKKTFLAGADSKQIHADAFVMSRIES